MYSSSQGPLSRARSVSSSDTNRPNINTDPKGLEASLHHFLNLHNHNSLILRHHTGNKSLKLLPEIVSVKIVILKNYYLIDAYNSRDNLKVYSFFFFPSQKFGLFSILAMPTWFINFFFGGFRVFWGSRESEEGGNKESGACLGAAGGSGERWGAGFVHKREANRAWD